MEAIEDYAAENTLYLELRTTPRALEGRPIDAYMDAILDATDECRRRGLRTTVRWLVSINRAHAPDTGPEALRLALKYRARGVVGLDFSGNYRKGAFADFRDVFARARDAGLQVALHFAENPDTHDEHLQMLEFAPGRLGHASSPGPAAKERLRGSRIPIEACVVCNVNVGWFPSVEAHPVGEWLAAGHPLCLCCDDRGVFDTSLTAQYVAVARAHLPAAAEACRAALRRIAFAAIDVAFVGEEEREELRARFVQWDREG